MSSEKNVIRRDFLDFQGFRIMCVLPDEEAIICFPQNVKTLSVTFQTSQALCVMFMILIQVVEVHSGNLDQSGHHLRVAGIAGEHQGCLTKICCSVDLDIRLRQQDIQ